MRVASARRFLRVKRYLRFRPLGENTHLSCLRPDSWALALVIPRPLLLLLGCRSQVCHHEPSCSKNEYVKMKLLTRKGVEYNFYWNSYAVS